MSHLLSSNLIVLGLVLLSLIGSFVFLFLQEQAISRFLSRRFGWNAVLVTGWLGVPIHELAHLFAAYLFGHRIISWKLFDPDPVTGTLGYVRHAYSKKNIRQTLGIVFIATAPTIFGALIIAGLIWWILPQDNFNELIKKWISFGNNISMQQQFSSFIFTQLLQLIKDFYFAVWSARSPWLPLQIYLIICIASHIAPSSADFKNGWLGVLLITVVIATVAVVCAYFGISTIASLVVFLPMLALLCTVTAFNMLWIGIMAALGLFLKRRNT